MKTIESKDLEILIQEIYETLICGYDSEGNEMDMGDMGICLDTAEQIIQDWIKKANITVTD